MHYAETGGQNKTTCSLEHQDEKQYPKMTCDSAKVQHLITYPECAKTYTDDNFRVIGQAWSSKISVLESVYIKNQKPVLCKQEEFIFSLGLFK